MSEDRTEVEAVGEAMDDWLFRMHGVVSSSRAAKDGGAEEVIAALDAHRSPQAEDHEAGIEAICRAWWPTWPKAPNPEGERRRAREAIAALSHVSPSPEPKGVARAVEALRTGGLSERRVSPAPERAPLARDFPDSLPNNPSPQRGPMDCERCGGAGRLDAMGGPAHHVKDEATTPCPDCLSPERNPERLVAIRDWLYDRARAESSRGFNEGGAALAEAAGALLAEFDTPKEDPNGHHDRPSDA